MPVTIPPLADPEIAGATLREHLDSFWLSGRPTLLGWQMHFVDTLHAIVRLPAYRPSGAKDHYFFRLGAEYYDIAPPTVALVKPDGVTIAPEPSQWFPAIDPKPAWFGLHSAYGYPDGTSRQLVCMSMAAEFYMTDHSPKESERWQQGRHTIAATLNRLATVLQPPFYKSPSA